MVTLLVVGSLVAAVLGAAFAFAVLRVGRHSPLASTLVSFLALMSLVQALLALTSAVPLEGWFVVLPPANLVVAGFLLATYLRLIRHLETPWVRHLQSRPGIRVATGALLVGPAGFAAMAAWHFGRNGAPQDFWSGTPAPLFVLLFALSVLVVAAFALIAAVSAWRRAPPDSLTRSRARAFALAFGVHDLCLVGSIVPGRFIALFDPAFGDRMDETLILLLPAGAILSMAFLSYGILRTQLLDIHVKIRWTISGTTLALLFVASFMVASELTRVLAPQYSLVGGLVAVALMALLIVPLRRLTDKVASSALPPEASTDSGARRLEIYRLAMEEGRTVQGSERFLSGLRKQLGITQREHDLLARFAAADSGASGPGPDVFGRFRIRRILGEGAQGRVFLADDVRLHRSVVVKVLEANPSAVSSGLQEARALAQVRHPNVVAVFDALLEDGKMYLVLEDAGKENIRDWLSRNGPPPPQEACRIATGILAGLAAVHSAGIVHGDLKPANILLTAEGVPRLADFGIATPADGDSTILDPEATLGRGSLSYLSPEQAQGAKASESSDVYAAGLIVYELVEGVPYLSTPAPATMGQRLARAANPGPVKSAPHAGAKTNDWLAHALTADRQKRFADGSAALSAWNATTEGMGPSPEATTRSA